MKVITIGRSSSCDIILSHPMISGHHATLTEMNGQYIFEDTSSNGSTINGQVIRGQRINIAPGTPIMLANQVPFPWEQAMMKLSSVNVLNNGATQMAPQPFAQQNVQYQQPANDEPINVFLGIVCFLIPLVGFIMYFVWRNDSPKKANQAGIISLISFAINCFGTIVAIS